MTIQLSWAHLETSADCMAAQWSSFIWAITQAIGDFVPTSGIDMEKLKEKNADRHEVYANAENKQTNERISTLARVGRLLYPKASSPRVVTDLSAARHGAL